MTQSKLSLPLALLLLFVMACTCGKMRGGNNRNDTTPLTSNSNESNDNKNSNDEDSSSEDVSTENKNASTKSSKTASTGIAECDAYLKMIDDYLNCPNLSKAEREQWANQRAELYDRFKEAGKTEIGKGMMVTVCTKAAEASKEGLKCK